MACPLQLSSGHLARLHHGSILFLEAVAYPFGALHLLLDASNDTAFLARAKSLGAEIANAIIETTLDELLILLMKRDEND
jgi:hypothetical protein